MEVINIALALATILFGGLALVSPNFALKALKLQCVPGHNDGKSELRAASGGAFVGTAVAAIALGAAHPMAWVMLGMHYGGAAVGRVTSIFLDNAGSRKMWMFFAIEAAFAAVLIGANWSAAVG